MRIKGRRNKEVIGGGLGRRDERCPSLCLLFSTLQKQRCSTEDKQRHVSHQQQEAGKHAGDISPPVKRLHSDAASALFHSVLALPCVEKQRFTSSLHDNIPGLPPCFPQPSRNICRGKVKPPNQPRQKQVLRAATIKSPQLWRNAAEYQKQK